ncbi:hypothetical protein C2845_PM17G12040 [Panicum miliaceum]|uniref:Uncharacterized protein n=1 Tax=Panicum miliaceum TaxID=4540 RepID=A0A3L6Q479_PANMI|nr:hypothetical protein C2845_PM17G12040 [Panicum miliaceum]
MPYRYNVWGPQDCINAYIVRKNLNATNAKIVGLREQRRKKNATYRAVIEALAGVAMSVEPPVITFSGGGRSMAFR